MQTLLRTVLLLTLVVAVATDARTALQNAPGTLAAPDPAPGELDRLAAFARVYGVVRYFYPSDVAADLDWDRFAVYGVRQVRAAGPNAFAATLSRLFSCLGPGIEIGTTLSRSGEAGVPDAGLIAWRYVGAGFSNAGPYRGKRTHRPIGAGTIDGFASLMQTVPAGDLRGRTVRLRGQVRAKSRDGTGAAALWLRVDRPAGATGFFDNMTDRPIQQPQWGMYEIEGAVAEDATYVAFGVMASGPVTADFDAIELASRNVDGRWSPVVIKDAGFETEPPDGTGGWARVGSARNVQISRPAEEAREGHRFLRLAPMPPSASDGEAFDAPAALTGAHVEVDLGLGLRARIPLALTDSQARAPSTPSAQLASVRAALDRVDPLASPSDIETRLADVVVAWNVLRHFYPYWTEAAVDWDARLRPELDAMYSASTRSAHRDALRALVADARDGHGNVVDTRSATPQSWLPVQFGAIDNRVVITASDAAAAVPLGAVVTSIDGVPAIDRLAHTMNLVSGTVQWKQVRALAEMSRCDRNATMTLVLDSGAGARENILRCNSNSPPAEQRPAPVSRLPAGIWYVDLTRADMPDVMRHLDEMSHASGVVFDLRGYPTGAGAGVLPYLIAEPEHDRWMHIAKITGPFGQSAGWESFGWDVTPKTPHIQGRTVFLTDGRAISYAESVMGYVAGRKLATIVGGTTAGTNGNVATFAVPGGFRITFTGMRVTGHDGQTPHHLVGVRPDIAVAPTIVSLRAGRDEVLERAVAVIQGR